MTVRSIGSRRGLVGTSVNPAPAGRNLHGADPLPDALRSQHPTVAADHRGASEDAQQMSADDASGPVKAAHKAAIEEVARRNEAAHKAAKEKRKAADRKSELFRRRAERDR
jgi:hypothetical protein